MHVLIIPSWYKTNENLVIGSFFEEQARGLMKAGHQVGIIYPTFLSFTSKLKIKSEIVQDNGLPTYYCGYKAMLPRSYRLNYHFFKREIFKIYLQYEKTFGTPDVIHAHTVFYGAIAADYISNKRNIPLVVTEHYTPFITGGVKHSADINIAKSIYKTSSCNLVVSSGFRKLLADKLQLPEANFKVLPNMVDSRFFEQKVGKIIDKSRPVFFTMSFLTERKNHKLMLDAFFLTVKKIPLAIFKIGGEGSIRKDLEAYAHNLGIKDNVFFLGELSREEAANEMSQCDVFLLASTFETFGVVLIEALACGKPVITTDSVGPRDIVNSNNGIIVSTQEATCFHEAMMKLMEDYEFYNSIKISEDCKERFSESVIISNLETIYSSVKHI